jgi:hypothetical protein
MSNHQPAPATTFDQQFAQVFGRSAASPEPVVGFVTYDVRVTCPHCQKSLRLNQHPYNDDSSPFCPAEDHLGGALFGSERKPATWFGISINYKCAACHGDFTVGSLEL